MTPTMTRPPEHSSSSSAPMPNEASSHSSVSPGVYVRQQHNPNELDMLWSGSRQFHKEDRSPIVFTAAGLILGVIMASAVFFLMSQKPQVSTGNSENVEVPTVSDGQLFAEENNLNYEPSTSETVVVDKPVESAASVLDKLTGNTESAETAEVQQSVNEPAAKPERASAAQSSSPKRLIHTVTSGDTLGRIAARYYGSSGTEAVSRIAGANNMTNPDDLSIGQRLVIPQ